MSMLCHNINKVYNFEKVYSPFIDHYRSRWANGYHHNIEYDHINKIIKFGYKLKSTTNNKKLIFNITILFKVNR